MLYRTLGKTGERVSVLGFGAMRLPVIDGNPANIDEQPAADMLMRAIDGGINYIDTAYPYHGGNSEDFVGRALEGRRDEVKIATKMPSWYIDSPSDMDRYLDEQLTRLRTDHIEFYLLHSLNERHWPRLMKHDALKFLDKAMADGRIKHAGFSFHDELPLFKEIVDAYDWSFCQIQYNYLDGEYQAGTEGLNYATERGLGMVIMEPLRGGMLAGNMPEDVMNIWHGADISRSPAEWALRYVMDRADIGCVLSGMSTMEQLEENLRIADEAHPDALTEDEYRRIGQVRDIYKARCRVNCTNCRYCMPCPAGVDIPKCLNFLNDYYMFQSLERASWQYSVFVPDENRASHCVECGMCMEVCPQGFDIPEALAEVHERLAPPEQKA